MSVRVVQRRLGPILGTIGLLASTTLLFTSIVAGCRRTSTPPGTNAPEKVASTRPAAKPRPSTDCRPCHEEIFKAWTPTDHARAHRPVDAAADADAFVPARDLSLHGVDYHIEWKNGRPEISEQRGNAPAQIFTPEFALGYKPLRQYIVPAGNGRYQAAELAFDPAKKDWFNVFADERRRPGEWGHWLGRGMNWNSMCAHCHLTDFNKRYDPVRDAYASTWVEHGVGCMQCHATLPADCTKTKGAPSLADIQAATAKLKSPNRAAPTPEKLRRAMETCAPCHARNELLTGTLHPGGAYHDYQRLTLPLEAAIFYPDGQVRDEDFNYTSLLTSRMGGKAGVTCLDCHDPHTTRTLLPANDNSLCMRCHATPGLPVGAGGDKAPVIDPLAHSHHKPDSAGNQCIACHMPTTTYMQRAPRHDHGFLKPDPLLTKELGIPNACSRCHADQTIDWNIKFCDEWYGAKMESRQRDRARVVAAAQHWNGTGATPPAADHAADAAVAEKLLALIASEEVPAWKATLLLLARHYVGLEPRVPATARTALADADPLVRSAAVQVLASVPGEAAAIRPLLADPSRLVRLDAAWALSTELPENSPIRNELDAYLAVSADQPAGRLRIAQDLFNRGRAAEAEAPLRKAAEWDPNSAGIYDALGIVLSEVGKSAEAAAALWRAATLNPADAQPAFNAALAFAQAGKLPDAELALRETIRRDPRHDRAHYNLGLLFAQTNRAPEALAEIETAERLAPRVADYPYARATLLLQRGDRAGALAAARRALEIDPQHGPARDLMGRLR